MFMDMDRYIDEIYFEEINKYRDDYEDQYDDDYEMTTKIITMTTMKKIRKMTTKTKMNMNMKK